MNTVSSTDPSFRKTFLYLYLLIAVVDLLATATGYEHWRYATKPLLMPALIGFFLANASQGPLNKWIVFALFFSWLGDVLLLFESRQSIFFLLGLSAFLAAHIFYIWFFHHLREAEQIKNRPTFLIIVALYYATLITILYPSLGDMRIAVPVYGIVISFMLLVAMHMLFLENKPAGRLMLAGVLLFVISDSLLALNKFYQPFFGAGVMIMLTYIMAQLLIVTGALRYIRMAKTVVPNAI